MRRSILLVLGVLLAIAGSAWTLQGLDLLGGSGGMNGHRIWAVIGPIAALAGLGFVSVAVRSGRATRGSSPRN